MKINLLYIGKKNYAIENYSELNAKSTFNKYFFLSLSLLFFLCLLNSLFLTSCGTHLHRCVTSTGILNCNHLFKTHAQNGYPVE